MWFRFTRSLATKLPPHGYLLPSKLTTMLPLSPEGDRASRRSRRPAPTTPTKVPESEQVALDSGAVKRDEGEPRSYTWSPLASDTRPRSAELLVPAFRLGFWPFPSLVSLFTQRFTLIMGRPPIPKLPYVFPFAKACRQRRNSCRGSSSSSSTSSSGASVSSAPSGASGRRTVTRVRPSRGGGAVRDA